MRPDEIEKMRCSECGSARIDIDKIDFSRYCRDCGVVLQELLVA